MDRSFSPQRILKVHLREPSLSDHLDIVAYRNLPEVRKAFINQNVITWPGHLEWFKQKSREPGFYMWAVYHEGKCVGTLSLEVAGGTAELCRVLIFPPYQGYGLGRAAVEAALEYAKTLGVHTVWLRTKQENKRAVALYKQIGFRQTDEAEVRSGGRWEKVIRMEKRLR